MKIHTAKFYGFRSVVRGRSSATLILIVLVLYGYSSFAQAQNSNSTSNTNSNTNQSVTTNASVGPGGTTSTNANENTNSSANAVQPASIPQCPSAESYQQVVVTKAYKKDIENDVNVRLGDEITLEIQNLKTPSDLLVTWSCSIVLSTFEQQLFL